MMKQIMETNTEEKPGHPFRIGRFLGSRTYYHLFLVLEQLAKTKPFAQYGLAAIMGSVTQQLRHGNYVMAMRRGRLIGYIGWLVTTEAIAEAWIRDEGRLRAVHDNPEVLVITILVAPDPRTMMAMARYMKLNVSQSRAYWKRDIQGRGLVPRMAERVRSE